MNTTEPTPIRPLQHTSPLEEEAGQRWNLIGIALLGLFFAELSPLVALVVHNLR